VYPAARRDRFTPTNAGRRRRERPTYRPQTDRRALQLARGVSTPRLSDVDRTRANRRRRPTLASGSAGGDHHMIRVNPEVLLTDGEAPWHCLTKRISRVRESIGLGHRESTTGPRQAPPAERTEPEHFSVLLAGAYRLPYDEPCLRHRSSGVLDSHDCTTPRAGFGGRREARSDRRQRSDRPSIIRVRSRIPAPYRRSRSRSRRPRVTGSEARRANT
jgi:hypothetical protein